ncbi:MAG TPA: GYD domain-containing protein [Nitrososphaerales archaeon]|nr:GYD domain-containing protein [Nitrososphaerales archaeon]
MGHYVLPLNWTDQGSRNVKEGPKRAAAFEKMVKRMDGEASYKHTLGQYDLVAIVKLDDDESIVKLGLELGRLGNVRTTTLKAWTRKEMADIFSSLKG